MVPQSDPTELELRDYLHVVRRRKWTIALATLLVVGAALAVSLLQTKVYQAEVEVLLSQARTQGLFDSETGQRTEPNREIQNEVQFLQSQTMENAAAEELGYVPEVSITTVDEADLIVIKAESTDPERAQDAANAYADTYIQLRRERSVDEYLSTQEVVQEKIDELDADIEALIQEQVQLINTIDDELAAAPSDTRRNELLEQRRDAETSAREQRQPLESRRSFYEDQLNRLQVASDLIQSGGAQVITDAELPESPIRPTPRRNVLVALIVGLILGAGLAFLFEYLDDSVKTKDDLERATGGATVLGLIPNVPGWRDRRDAKIVSLAEPTSPAAEAYRSLRTSVQFLGLDRPIRTLQVTSPRASEGKTTTIANLGVALARAGQRVIIVCCDLRRPRVHEFFDLSNGVGFTSVLLGEVPLSAAIQQVPGQERLYLLASGPTPPNPSELLSSHRTADVLTAMLTEADIVLIDCPPVLPVTDALVLSGAVDATILVATSGITTRKEAHRAAELLQQVDAPMLGCVLNGVSSEAGYGYGYGYGYGEPSRGDGRDDGARGRSRRRVRAHAERIDRASEVARRR